MEFYENQESLKIKGGFVTRTPEWTNHFWGFVLIWPTDCVPRPSLGMTLGPKNGNVCSWLKVETSKCENLGIL